MSDFDWTQISADIAAAIDFVREHGGVVDGGGHTNYAGTRVSFTADAETLKRIGGSWAMFTAGADWVAVKTEIAGVNLYARSSDPAVIKVYGRTPITIDWSE